MIIHAYVSNNLKMNHRHILILALFFQITLTLNCQETKIDSTILSVDTATIDGIQYKAIFKTNDDFYILDSNENIVFKSNVYSRSFEFVDFDNDGMKDILFNYNSNIPINDLLLYDINNKGFTPVEDFSKYPEPIKIKGTKYFYSYHKSGCADMIWDSDLFFIQNFRAVPLGYISGDGCIDEEEKGGIYIYKIKGDKKTLFKTFDIETINKFTDNKWGFIKDFWTNNYMDFE
jgi:hypothetical protein